MFKGRQLYIQRCLMRKNILNEKHSGGLAGHFGQNKTIAQLQKIIIGLACKDM